MPLILIFYLVASWYVGYILISCLGHKIPVLLEWTGAFLVGTLITIPITYVLSCLFASTGQPILFGTLATTALLFVIGIQYRKRIQTSFTISEIALAIFSIVCSSWIMFKTFHGDASGQLFVGSNNVFDFSHVLGIVRSFSFGSNIPFLSPFQAGLPYLYHFFFAYYVGLWEFFWVPVVWAMNIPSILAFVSLLVAIFYVPQLVFKQSSKVGWIAVLLTLTNSTLTWWQLLIQKGLSVQTLQSLWVLPTYPFAGPFDGSTISLFMTLNNYVNQRHLAFAIACSLFLVTVIVKEIEQKRCTWKQSFVYGVFFGLLGMWNIAIMIVSILSVALLLFFHRLWKEGLLFGVTTGCMIFLWYGQYLLTYAAFLTLGTETVGISPQEGWNAARYFFMNLSVLPIIVCLGYVVLGKKVRAYGLPFLLLCITLCLISVIERRGLDQKFLSFLIIWANVFAAIGVGWFWQRKSIIFKFFAVCLFAVLTISGVIDLMPIKNEFAYPLVDNKMLPVISWIKTNTAKDTVFVSYSDMVDPVVFAGRKNYYGFFGNIGRQDRSPEVKNIYEGNIDLAKTLGISYILVPKWNKNDFPYVVDTMYFTEHQMVVYEDERYVIYSTTRK